MGLAQQTIIVVINVDRIVFLALF